MSNPVGYAIPALLQIVPIILEFKKQQQEGIDLDVRSLAERVGGALDIEDTDEFVEEQVKRVIRNGAGIALDDKAAKIVADIVVKASGPIMTALVGFAKGEMKRAILLKTLSSVLDRSNTSLLKVFQEATDMPEGMANVLAKRIGLSVVVLCCLGAAYRILNQFMIDDEAAKEFRADIEKSIGEVVARLKEEQANLEEFVSKCMLNALDPIKQGIGALGLSMFGESDEGTGQKA